MKSLMIQGCTSDAVDRLADAVEAAFDWKLISRWI